MKKLITTLIEKGTLSAVSNRKFSATSY